MEKETEQYDVVIIGGGAAGLTTATYCECARLKILMIERALVGGLAAYTNEIENYPGFPEGSTGLGLIELLHRQAKKFGIKFKLTDVRTVQLEGDTKVVGTFRTSYKCRSVIIASGGGLRSTGAPGEDKFLYDKGISFCTTCDTAANTGKTVVVISSDDAAVEEGMFLTKFASEVIVNVIHEEGKMDCNEIAGEEALTNPEMESIQDTPPEEFRGGEEHLHSVALKNLKTSEIIDMPVGICFLFIGYVPNAGTFKDIIGMNRSGYMLTNEKMGTSIPGIFAAGGMCDKFLKQVATAVGDGAIAGYVTEKYLAENEVFENQITDPSLPGPMYVQSAVETVSRGLLPVIEGSKQERSRGVKVTRVDIYKSAGTANRLDITTVPNVAFIRDGKLAEALTEDITKKAFKAAL